MPGLPSSTSVRAIYFVKSSRVISRPAKPSFAQYFAPDRGAAVAGLGAERDVDLEQLGLIYAPHTSAGRLPTELGLRFFVDALMQLGDLTSRNGSRSRASLPPSARRNRSKQALGEALTRLSGLTRAAAVVLTAKSNSRLKHIEFVRLEPERALVVLVGEDGQVENRVLRCRPGFPHRHSRKPPIFSMRGFAPHAGGSAPRA